jgi:hypothetical protein
MTKITKYNSRINVTLKSLATTFLLGAIRMKL